MIFKKAAIIPKVNIQTSLVYMKHKLYYQKKFRFYLGLAAVAIISGAVGVYMTFISQATLLAPVGNCYSQEGCVEQARSSKDFTASVGVNTHVGYGGTVYRNNWPMVRDRLIELGASHVRDGTFAAGYSDITQLVADRYNELNTAGIKGNLLVGHEQQVNGNSLETRLNWIKTKVPDFTTSIEGTNEWDTQSGNASRIQSLRDMQCDIYNRVKADSILAPKTVIGPSAGAPFSGSTWNNWIGDLSGCLDRGNMHPYPGADPPHRHQSRDLSAGAVPWAQITSGNKPLWITETGYWNHTSDPNDVSERASGVYIPRAFLENFRRGFERTQAYELIDLNTGTGSGQVIDNYGLLRTDGNPKPAFTAIKNTLAIIKDTASASGSLGFGIVCHTNCKNGDPNVFPTQDGPIRHVLLKHSSGAYYLAIWSESKVWDPATKTDTPKLAQGFNLNLHEAPGKVEIFDPATGTSPISTDISGNKLINTTAPDSLRLIKITPATQAPPVTGMSLEAESMSVTPTFPSIPNPSVVQADSTASAGQRLAMLSYGTASKSITTSGPASSIVVRAQGDQCQEASGIQAPNMTLKLDGTTVGSKSVTSSTWADSTFIYNVPAGSHTVAISYDNDYENATCNRNLYLDKVDFVSAAPAADTTPPTVSITNPPTGTTVAGTITAAATAYDPPATTDGTGVTKVEFLVDGVLKLTDTTAPYNYFLDTKTLTNGSHTITAKAYDAASNIGTTANTVTVNNVDTVAPNPPSSLTGTTTQPTATTASKVVLTWPAATDNGSPASGIKSYLVQRGGVTIATVNASTLTYTDNNLPTGSYSYVIRAVDNVNLTSTTSSPAYNTTINPVPTPPPDTNTFQTPPTATATTASSTQINVAWSGAADPDGIAGYNLYRGTSADTVTTKVNTNLLTAANACNGTTTCSLGDTSLIPGTIYYYQVEAIDNAGKAGKSNAANATTKLVQTFSITPTDDAWVSGKFKTRTYGTTTQLKADGSPELDTLLKFNVTGTAGKQIKSAKLRLYVTNSSNQGGTLYKLLSNTWSETNVTWNTAPSASTTSLGSLGPVTAGSIVELDLASLITGDGTYGIKINNTSRDDAIYSSKEATSNRPELVLIIE